MLSTASVPIARWINQLWCINLGDSDVHIYECDFYVCLHIRSSVLLLWEYVSQVEKLVKAAPGGAGLSEPSEPWVQGVQSSPRI